MDVVAIDKSFLLSCETRIFAGSGNGGLCLMGMRNRNSIGMLLRDYTEFYQNDDNVLSHNAHGSGDGYADGYLSNDGRIACVRVDGQGWECRIYSEQRCPSPDMVNQVPYMALGPFETVENAISMGMALAGTIR